MVDKACAWKNINRKAFPRIPPTALSMIQEVERKYPLASISCMVEVTSESAEEANSATTRRHWDLSAVPNQALVPTKKECVV